MSSILEKEYNLNPNSVKNIKIIVVNIIENIF